jgi:hypothetical protein
MAYIMPLIPQQIEWYSLPIGYGLRGTNIHPGQVHRFVQTDILSSRQLTHPGLKQAGVWVLNACTSSFTWWNRCLNDGGGSKVNERLRKINSKRRLDMKVCKRKGAPENIWETLLAQYSRLALPWEVAIRKIKPKNEGIPPMTTDQKG